MKSKPIKVGDRFGEWTVIDKGEKSGYSFCRCSCGVEREVNNYFLQNGRSRSCGHVTRERIDARILGKKFGKLTPLKRVSGSKKAKYLCKCDCGNEVVVDGNGLLYKGRVSCGCINEMYTKSKKPSDLKEGTRIKHLLPKLDPRSTTGYRGVTLFKNDGLYLASLKFKGESEYLGYFKTAEEAYLARLEAEEEMYKPILKKYGLWNEDDFIIKKGEKYKEWKVLFPNSLPGKSFCRSDTGELKEIPNTVLLDGDDRRFKLLLPKYSPKTNTKYRGVVKNKRRKSFKATIKIDGVDKDLGTYSTAEKAYLARLKAEDKFYKPILSKHGLLQEKSLKIKKGDKFGEWTVIYPHSSSENSFCRCSCGTMREVNNSNLLNGKSKSCGHLIVNKNRKEAYAKSDKNLIGKTFGELTVLKRVNDKGNSKYLCRCSCGKEIILVGAVLLAGKQKSCGHANYKGYDKFHEIKELGTKDLQSKRVDGTSLYAITTKKPSNNKSGYKGVSYMPKKKKYRAYLGLRGKQINLGLYDTAEEAYQARLAGEEKYYKPILEKYEDKLDK